MSLIKNFCYCLEKLQYGEPLIHQYNDSHGDYSAPKFSIKYNVGEIIWNGDFPWEIAFNVTLTYFSDQPLDCEYFDASDKDRNFLVETSIMAAIKRSVKLISCLVDKSNPYAKSYRRTPGGEDPKGTSFRLPEQPKSMRWVSNTDREGGNTNCEWWLKTSFKIVGKFDHCC